MYRWTMHCVKMDTGEIIDREAEAPDEQTAETLCRQMYPRPEYVHHWVTSRDPALLQRKSEMLMKTS